MTFKCALFVSFVFAYFCFKEMKTFIILQNILFQNKGCSFELSLLRLRVSGALYCTVMNVHVLIYFPFGVKLTFFLHLP